MNNENCNIILIGNPNTGKSSIFNLLTGLKQKIGNYPGVTVEKKTGICEITPHHSVNIIDLPGIYSLYSNSIDETVALQELINPPQEQSIDLVIVTATVQHLKRNLLLFTQIQDLGLPCVLALNMSDKMTTNNITIDIPYIEQQLHTKIILLSTRKKKGFEQLNDLIKQGNFEQYITPQTHIDINSIDSEYIKQNPNDDYRSWVAQFQDKTMDESNNKPTVNKILHREAILRYQLINNILKSSYQKQALSDTGIQGFLDKWLTHKIFGYVFFLFILFLIFQGIYFLSIYPMDIIDSAFPPINEYLRSVLPEGIFTDLLTEGIISGIGAVVIFIPQIAMLFLFLGILEESGYMSRVVYLMDNTMKRFGLSGKSIVPLISGVACAIPAVMACRNIENWRQRLFTIFVVPFMTCSARLPVYIIIITLVIPNQFFAGFNLQGIVLLAMYLIGVFAAMLFGYLLKQMIPQRQKTFFIIELPEYKAPLLKNLLITIYTKTSDFVINTGKIILAFSVVLWFLGSHGPGEDFEQAETIVSQQYPSLSPEELSGHINSYQLEHSYIGILGKTIEPVVTPLGYDWKIAIALINSFVAREIFVSTLATIYSINSSDEDIQSQQMLSKMRNDIRKETGKPLFNLPTGLSLMIFYAFAMQCMSTLAVVKRETNSWKWPIIQMVSMTGFAYLCAFITFQIFR